MADPGARLYGLLLRCYPREFRRRFEADMRDTFARERRDAGRRGATGLFTFWLWTSIDAVRFGVAERQPRGRREKSLMKQLFAVDLRDALRSLRASPIVTAVAVLSLALGIGANATLFSILDSLLLKTLPVAAPDRLVVIDDGSWTNPIWESLRAHRRQIFDDAFAWSAQRFNLSTHGETDFVDGAFASGGMYDVLGVHAVLGRTFTEADDVRGGGPDGAVAVVSYGFWQRRMGGAPDAIGRHLSVGGVDATVIGVTPRGFFGPDVGRSADITLPLADVSLQPGEAGALANRSMWWLEIMGRMRPGQTAAQATALLDAAQAMVRSETFPPDWPAKEQADYLKQPWTLISAANGESDLRTAYYDAAARSSSESSLRVLAIACANLANLLLARAAARRHEFSVRLALGASRWRLGKQLLLESFILATAGAGLGLVISRWGSALLVRQLSTAAAGVSLDLSFDGRVIAFTTAVAVLAALVFGTAPAFGVSGVSPQETLREQSRSIVGERRFGLRNLLVAVQVALSLALVVGALLFVRTLTALAGAPLGFDVRGVTAVDVDARANPPARELRLQLFDRLQQAAAATPGVQAAAVSSLTPVGRVRWNTAITGLPNTAQLTRRQQLSWVNAVSPGWFHTIGMRVIKGRDFDAHDTATAPRALIVNESFGRRFFPGVDPLGRRLTAGIEGIKTYTFQVVGVVNDAVYSSPRAGFEPTLYLPLAQLDAPPSRLAVVVRADAPPPSFTSALSAEMARADAQIAYTIHPLATQLRSAVRQERLVAMLAGFFGALALLLAAVGLYGVVSHSVTRRRGEIGIRIALGAEPRGVIRLVLVRLAGLLIAGLLVGMALSWWTVRLFEKLLFGLSPRDPSTFAAAAAILLAAGLVAGWVPARRAAHIDPVEALR